MILVTRRLSFLVCIAAAIIIAAPGNAADDSRTLALITTLSNLNAQGARCGDELDINGYEAISGATCTRFTKNFQASWRDSDLMDKEVAAYMEPLETGDPPCDQACLSTLQHIDQLKTLVHYYLDYIDYLIELEN